MVGLLEVLVVGEDSLEEVWSGASGDEDGEWWRCGWHFIFSF